MSSLKPRKKRMGSSRLQFLKNLDSGDGIPKDQADKHHLTMEQTESLADLVPLHYSETGNEQPSSEFTDGKTKLLFEPTNKKHCVFKDPVAETMHETADDVANTSETQLGGNKVLHPSVAVFAHQSRVESPEHLETQKGDTHPDKCPGTEQSCMSELHESIGEERTELSEDIFVKQMGLLPVIPEAKLMSKLTDDERSELSQGTEDDIHPRHYSSWYSDVPKQSFTHYVSNNPMAFPYSSVDKDENQIPASDVRDINENTNTVGQHPPADLSKSDQMSCLQNQLSLRSPPNNDDSIVGNKDIPKRRRKMASSRWTGRSLKDAKVTQGEEMTKHGVISEKIYEMDPKQGHPKDHNQVEERAENVTVEYNEPDKISGATHVTISENKHTTQEGSPGMSTVRITPGEENLQECQEFDNKDTMNLEDAVVTENVSGLERNGFKIQPNDNDSEPDVVALTESHSMSVVGTPFRPTDSICKSEENQVTDGGRGVSGLHSTTGETPTKVHPSERYSAFDQDLEGRRKKMGSNRMSKGQHHHEAPPENEDHIGSGDSKRLSSNKKISAIGTSKEQGTDILGFQKKPVANNRFGDHSTPNTFPSQQISGKATLTLDTPKNYDLGPKLFNVVMVGSSNVGKTSFMKRVKSGTFSSDFCASIGIDTCIQAVTVDQREVSLMFWDTAGQERFHSISRQIFHKGQAFLLIYDITSSKSFSDVRYWISCIQESAVKDVIILLLGNKSDCAKRQVKSAEGEGLAKEYNIGFKECSAATGENIIASMESLARMLTEKYHKIEEGIVMQEQQRKPLSCC